MAYEGNDYKEATKYFDEVSGEEKYKEKLSYFQADMNFKLGKFEKAIQTGQTAMAKSNALEKSELNKIIGESYFNLKQYDKAIPYLKEYKGKKGRWNNTDFYQLGYHTTSKKTMRMRYHNLIRLSMERILWRKMPTTIWGKLFQNRQETAGIECV
jgi:tetratricopeptide (TPR) repeat protein